MFGIYFLSCILLLAGDARAVGNRVHISVFYESLCSDSIRFITQQLFPTYKLIGNAMKIDLIPFGKATVKNESGKLQFTCQHGPSECYANKYHSCAIALFSVEESTEFVDCDMKKIDPSLDINLEKCANSSDIAWASLGRCYKTGQADKLLEINGQRTTSFEPAITFVPTVVFNGHFDDNIQEKSLADLLSVVCEFLGYLPDACKKYYQRGSEVILVTE